MSARHMSRRPGVTSRTPARRARLLGAGLVLTLAATACSDNGGGDDPEAGYPTRAITIIVPFGAGGGVDINARAVAPYLEEELDVTVTVENRTGAGGLTGHTMGSTAAPDGYTLTFVSPGIIGAPLTTEGAGHGPTDFEFIGQVTEVPNFVTVRADSEWTTIGELVDYANANPGELVTGRSGFTSKGIAGELFRHEADIEVEMTEGWEGGAELMAAIIAGDVDYIMTDSNELASRDDLLPLCASASERSEALPDVPTCSEEGLDRVTQGVWRGLAAPQGTPEEITQVVSDALVAALDSAELQADFQTAGLTIDHLDSAAFLERVEFETGVLTEVFDELGVLVSQ